MFACAPLLYLVTQQSIPMLSMRCACAVYACKLWYECQMDVCVYCILLRIQEEILCCVTTTTHFSSHLSCRYFLLHYHSKKGAVSRCKPHHTLCWHLLPLHSRLLSTNSSKFNNKQQQKSNDIKDGRNHLYIFVCVCV